jgi:hypothetical protein
MENKDASSPPKEKATRLLAPSSASTALAPNTNWPAEERETVRSLLWDNKFWVCNVIK